MKNVSLLIILVGLLSCTAQKKTPKQVKEDKVQIAIAKVDYLFRSKPRKYVLEQAATLYVNNNNSLFVTAKGAETMVVVEGELGPDGYMQDEIGDLIYKDFSANSLKIREKIWGKPFISQENIPALAWEINTETKKIGSFDCQLAKTNFRGRQYMAWFCKDIPFSDGPWKFSGLPGLILEIYDSKMDYQFIIKSIEMPTKEETTFEFSNNGEELSFEIGRAHV